MSEAKDKDDFSQFNILDDLNDFDQYNIVDDTEDLLNLINSQDQSSDREAEINENESNLYETDSNESDSDDILKSLDFLLDEMKDEQGNINVEGSNELEDEVNSSEKSIDKLLEEQDDVLSIKDNLYDETGSDHMDNTNEKDELFDILDKMLLEEDESKEINNETNDYLNTIDDDVLENNDSEVSPVKSEFDSFDFESLGIDDFEQNEEQSSEDVDILSISNLEDNKSKSNTNGNKSSNDMSGVFSDVLGAVSTLEDPLEENLDKLISKNRPAKNAKKKQMLNEINEESVPKEKKNGLFAKLFRNIKDESEEDYVSRVKSEKEAEEKEAEEKKTKALETKANKAKKVQETKDAKQKAKAEKQAAVKDLKEKKAKAKAEKAAKEAEEAAFVYEGKINKVGASVVILFFAIIAVVVIVGTNVFSYRTSIKYASEFYEKQKYEQAYNELAGMKIKGEDKEIYNKVKTIMYVNRELTSYNNYVAMKHYPEALDSLLQGLSKYDKYITVGKKIGVKKDLDNVKGDIVTALNDKFEMTETDANKILGIKDKKEYGKNVYKIAISKTTAKKVSSIK